MRDAFEANGISRDIAGKTIVDLACGDNTLKVQYKIWTGIM